MKQTQKLINWLAVGGVALAMVTSLTAQTAKERTGQVVRLKGNALYSTGNNDWQPVKVGTRLKAGNTIRTAAGSFVDIVLGETVSTLPSRVVVGEWTTYQPRVEQDVIRLSEDSVLAIDTLTVMETGADQVTDTYLDLKAGRIFGRVKKLSSTSHYEIKFPRGVAVVRGTIYNVNGLSQIVQVLSGSVNVKYNRTTDGTPQTRDVPAGFQFEVPTELLTPLPPERDMGPPPVLPPPPPPIAPDVTIRYVSPT